MVTIIGFILIISFGIVFLLYSSKNKGKSKSQKSGATKEEELSNEIKESHKVRGVSNKDIPQKDIADFMEFDKIVMNPPFEKKQDVKHILRAYSLLKNGGKFNFNRF